MAFGRDPMNHIRARAVLVLLAVGSFTPPHDCTAAGLPAPLRTDTGLISGRGIEGVAAFKGIPYAAAPIGALRWRPPRPCPAWDGVRACDTFGPSCPQPGPLLGPPPAEMSEDCLYLNVWTAAASAAERRPVMLWIHGGGYTTGEGSSGFYDGTHFAGLGVVLVTINYRLGPFGFFAHPGLSAKAGREGAGNYGLLDQIAALKWVQRNIAAFGGDPDCVTIFGESAGAGSVACLMASPLARGLFHRAIMQSGFAQAEPLAGAESTGREISRALSCHEAPDELAALRGKSAEEVLAAANPVQGLFGRGNKFKPVVDGHALPESPREVFLAGRQAPVPVIAGSNADDGSLFVGQLPVRGLTGYRLALRTIFAGSADEAAALFPAARDEEVPQALSRLITVAAFVSPARTTVSSTAAAGQQAYLYHFTRVPPTLRGSQYGSCHAAEIPYVFGNLGRQPTEVDRSLSRAMAAYWVQFARTGDPNAEGLPTWPTYHETTARHLVFGEKIKQGSGLYKEACDLLAARPTRPPG